MSTTGGYGHALKVSYSGVRGIYGETLTPEVAYGFARALGAFLGPREVPPLVLLGRDNRPSGPTLREAVLSGLGTFPCRVHDLGVCATPTAQLASRVFQADATIVITASHNPRHWNGFKFFLPPNYFVMDGPQTKALFERYLGVVSAEAAPSVPPIVEDWGAGAADAHVQGVLEAVNVPRIQERKFRVAVDFAGGAGRDVAVRVLEALHCTVIPVDSHREPEPAVEFLGELREAVVANGCQVGAAQDMDGDRLVLINHKGEARGEDLTLSLAVWHLLQRVPPGRTAVVVKNSSTTALIDELCRQSGARLVETPVGEVNLSSALFEAIQSGNVAFGGEGSGGVIYPPLLYGRDGACGLALTLDALAATGQTLEALEASMPRYTMAKTKVPVQGDLPSLYARVQDRFPQAQASTRDGLKLTFLDGSWLQVRPSNTEPIVRITAEAKEPSWAQDRVDEVGTLLNG